MSEFTELLLVSPLDDGNTWVIQKEFTYYIGEEGSAETVVVPRGFQTDFASVPPLLTVVVPRWGKYGKAAIIHDFCYSKKQFTRARADEIFQEAMGVLGVAGWRAFLMYWAVRAFGWMAWRTSEGSDHQDRVPPVPEKAAAARQW